MLEVVKEPEERFTFKVTPPPVMLEPLYVGLLVPSGAVVAVVVKVTDSELARAEPSVSKVVVLLLASLAVTVAVKEVPAV